MQRPLFHYLFNLAHLIHDPSSSERLLNNVRSWHTCNQRSATLRQISYRSPLPFTRGCGRTGRSEVRDPDFEISWTWRETMVSATVCRTEMGVKVTSGVNSFLWPSIKECENRRVCVCVSRAADRADTRHREQRSDFFLFFFSLKSPLVQSRNSIGNFLSPASLSPISVTPPHSPLVHSTTLSAFHESGVITWEESTFDQSHSF